MKMKTLSVTAVVTLMILSVSNLYAGDWGQGFQSSKKSGSADNRVEAVSQDCSSYYISGPAEGAGSTSGDFGSFIAGDSFTFTATGNGTGTWRIVGDPDGATTYASGGTFPGTLTYTIPAGQTADGMGFYVDSYTGSGDTITGTCGGASKAVPTLAFWTRLLMVVLLGFVGFAAFQRRRRQ